MPKRFLTLFTAAAIGGATWWALSATPSRRPLPRRPRSLQPQECGVRCGVERWAVKTLSDRSRSSVDFHPVPATIAELAALPRPDRIPDTRRVSPVETTVYRVRGYLVAYKPEDDHDMHVILADMEHQRITLITEIPDPACAGACNSGLGAEFAAARAALDTILHTPNPTDEPILVEVTGVGFFDRDHGQTGAAPNNLELHPVLSLARIQR